LPIFPQEETPSTITAQRTIKLAKPDQDRCGWIFILASEQKEPFAKLGRR